MVYKKKKTRIALKFNGKILEVSVQIHCKFFQLWYVFLIFHRNILGKMKVINDNRHLYINVGASSKESASNEGDPG